MTARKCLAFLLVISMLMALIPAATANSSELMLDVNADGANRSLRVLQVGGTWYAEANDLAALGNNKASVNHEMNKLSIYKTDANNDIICILYSENLDSAVEYAGNYYVPLQKVSVETGVHFYSTDPLKVTALRTPKQMIDEMEDVFYDQRYQITQILLADGYAIGGTFAHIYAVLPFVGSGSLWGAVSGSDQADRYRNAMTAILENDGEMSTFLNDTIDLTNDVHKNAKILRAVQNLTKKGGKIYEYLLSKGVSKTLLDALAYEKDPYDNLDGFFEGWSDVLNAVNIGHFLEICSFYYAAVDTEESILLAMKRVFENSEDEHARNAVRKLMDARYGEGGLAIADIYGGTLWDITTEFLSDKAEKLFYGSYADTAKLIARGIDMATGASDKSEAFIYFPIFASIQQDLYDYFIRHQDDTQEHTMYDLRAVTIMYLKAALAAYEYAAFDESLKDTLTYAANVLNEELAYILSYSEYEYAPDYDNQNIIDWLNDGAVVTEPIESAYPSTEELFDNTCWHMCYGQSLGFNYYGLFRPDGTLRVRGVNGLEYPDGTYDYESSTGRMTVYFNNWADEFQYGDGSFTSVDKYQMQVGEDYLTISPDPEGAQYFEEEPVETEPAETEPIETEPSTPRSGYSVEDFLEHGFGVLLNVSEDCEYPDPDRSDFAVLHLDGEELVVDFDLETGEIERITIWKMGGSLEITDGVYSDMSYEELKNAWGNTYDWSDIQYDFPYGGGNPETDIHDAFVEFTWGESGNGDSGWSDWSWDRQSIGANQEEEVRTVWGYYYYPCAECGAHMHGYNDICWTWAGGCGKAKIPHDWHEVWSTVSWEDANLQDWHGTGKFYTYIDGELVFKWTEHGSARQQYRYRTVGSSTPAYQVTLSFCAPIAETGNIPVVQLITIERTRTGRSGGELADGEYYGYLLDWDDTCMTIEQYIYEGWNYEYPGRIFTETGEYVTLDLSNCEIWLDWEWSDDDTKTRCESIDAALDTKIWGGGTTVGENCPMTIFYIVENGVVSEVTILYAP